ncbi:hypothetical protein FIBSPDRAFT_969386 [Athelia psychrophila]|uniref:Uncharacterized protein n=1 Tax=Athelia psychrophila TaxID=1759441 RepID=A0A167TK00_9AGAM|nr:hypothetical protein FIBSPDRAFT_969386 [Fibularhizoctonia sp. CBS 109695]
MSRVYSSARPSKRPVARVDQTKLSSRMLLHQECPLGAPILQEGRLQVDSENNDNAMSTLVHAPHAMRNMIYAHHYAYNHLALFQPEIGDFAHGLVKTLDSETPLLSRLLHAKYSASESIPDRDIVSEEMSRSPDTVAKLQAELDASMPEPLAIPFIRALQNLLHLSPFITDGLRVHGAVPSLPERVLPSHLQKKCLPRAFDLMDYSLPPGTVVATQAWSMHPRPRRVPSTTHLPPRPVALPDRGPTRADAGAYNAFPHGIVDLGEWRSQ